MPRTALLMLAGALVLAGCADPYRNLYDGIRNQREAQRTPQERSAQPSPDYDAYRREREAHTPRD